MQEETPAKAGGRKEVISWYPYIIHYLPEWLGLEAKPQVLLQRMVALPYSPPASEITKNNSVACAHLSAKFFSDRARISGRGRVGFHLARNPGLPRLRGPLFLAHAQNVIVCGRTPL